MTLHAKLRAADSRSTGFDYPPSTAAVSWKTILTIKNARVLCITFVTFVHVYSGFEGFPILTGFDAADVYYKFLADVLGRSAVPLLTIISGWLFFSGRPYGQLVRDKAASLLLPMLAWNLIMLAALATYAVLVHGPMPGIGPNSVLALVAQPVNIPLGFLRDLFVVMMLSPLIVRGVRAGGLLFVILLAIIAVVLPYSMVLLRTQIVFFFALGIWLRHRGIIYPPRWSVAVASAVVVGVFLAELVVVSNGARWASPPYVEIVQRLSVSVLVWTAAMWLASRPAGVHLAQIEPFVFLAFCSHYVVFRALSIPLVTVFGDMRSPLYPIYFTLQPILALVFAAILHRAIRPSPILDVVLNAGSKRRRKDAPQYICATALHYRDIVK